MGYTLDQLLDETGVKDLAGGRMTKKASAPKADFSKLAERCRRAATATPEEMTDSSNQELAEKTAAIAVIGHTLAEIREIEGGGQNEKTASVPAGFSAETFIKTALEAGHSPESIAAFLEKNAFFGKWRAGRAISKAERLTAKAKDLKDVGIRRLQSEARKIEGLPDVDKAKFVEGLRVKFGDKGAAEALKDVKGFAHLPGVKALPREVAEAAGPALGLNIGGSKFGITSEQLKKAKKPAMYAGAGLLAHRALTSDKKEEPRRPGVVVVGG